MHLSVGEPRSLGVELWIGFLSGPMFRHRFGRDLVPVGESTVNVVLKREFGHWGMFVRRTLFPWVNRLWRMLWMSSNLRNWLKNYFLPVLWWMSSCDGFWSETSFWVTPAALVPWLLSATSIYQKEPGWAAAGMPLTSSFTGSWFWFSYCHPYQ